MRVRQYDARQPTEYFPNELFGGPDAEPGYRGMLLDFLRCLKSGGTPYSNLVRARRDLEIVFRAYEQLP